MYRKEEEITNGGAGRISTGIMQVIMKRMRLSFRKWWTRAHSGEARVVKRRVAGLQGQRGPWRGEVSTFFLEGKKTSSLQVVADTGLA